VPQNKEYYLLIIFIFAYNIWVAFIEILVHIEEITQEDFQFDSGDTFLDNLESGFEHFQDNPTTNFDTILNQLENAYQESDPSYMGLLASCLMNIYHISKDEMRIKKKHDENLTFSQIPESKIGLLPHT